ncbi:MAG: alpha/beta hydrolase [Chitinophagaceae bacterium]
MKPVFYSNLILRLVICITLYACKTTRTTPTPLQEKSLNLTAAPSPIKLNDSQNKFYKDIAYGELKENVFDIFLPASKQPSSLVIYVFGGGFIRGNQAQPYNAGGPLINALLSKNIAYASINYRYLSDDGQGVFKCFNDVIRGLQFIRYHSKELNIDKTNIVLMGGSAGAGTSLWIGFHDDMADKKNIDPVLRESTRLKGMVAIETQANYDILDWHNSVFSEYNSKGLDQKSVMRLGTAERMATFFGFKNLNDADSKASKEVRDKLNMLKLMSSDDPEIYVENVKQAYAVPTALVPLQHHPLHAKALMDRAKETHVKGTFNIPAMNIDTRNGENIEGFITRVLTKK